jgi:DNA polymerase-3 subunit epsilon
MREIIFDTETTGLDNREDRIIEFGAVELVNRFPTGRTFHAYINPQGRAIHPDALAVHGIGEDILADKPGFDVVAAEIMEFVGDAMLVAHNASFDVGFINSELSRIGMPPLEPHRIIDTLAIARRRHPMGPNSLDALCRRYAVDSSRRTKHGALLDSELLAEVYIELIGGKQAALVLETASASAAEIDVAVLQVAYERPRPLAPRLSAAEAEAHRALVEGLGVAAIWARIEQPSP